MQFQDGTPFNADAVVTNINRILSGMILSPAAIQSLGDQLGNAPTNAGTGPFMFSSWVKGDHLTIVRNPHYWGKDSSGNALPYLDKVNYRPITDESVMYTNLETGTINVAMALAPTDVSNAQVDSLLEDARASSDQGHRTSDYQQAEQLKVLRGGTGSLARQTRRAAPPRHN